MMFWMAMFQLAELAAVMVLVRMVLDAREQKSELEDIIEELRDELADKTEKASAIDRVLQAPTAWQGLRAARQLWRVL